MTADRSIPRRPHETQAPRRRYRRWIAGALTAALVAAGTLVALPATVATAEDGATVFHAVTPVRLVDTRQADCGCERLDDATIRVRVAGSGGVPAEATAAAITVTTTGTAGPGYATVWPSGTARQETSNVNWAAGETRANGAIVQLGTDGSVDVYVSSTAFVLIDVAGAFVPANGPTEAGRFQPIEQERVVDTRPSEAPADTQLNVPRPSVVPADATALAVTITITGSTGWGFVSAVPAGGAPPEVSVVNVDGPGQTRAATAIVPMSPSGIDLYVDGRMHVLVDVVGWFTGEQAEASAEGRFVPNAPTRLLDTRAPFVPIWAGGTRELQIDGDVDVDAALAVLNELIGRAGAVVYNLTVAETSADGWITAYPARTDRPGTSTINWGPDEIVANLAITPLSERGVAYYAFREADVIVDVTGYFTGPPTPATGTLAPNDTPSYDGESPRDLVRDSVPDAVWNVLGDVDMHTVPALEQGAWGRAATPPDRIAFAYVIYQHRRSLARSVAAHEVGHILAFRWIRFAPGGSEARIDAIGGHECIAEALGRLMFAQLGRSNYQPGYGTTYIACSTSVAAGDLAAEIIAATT